MLNPNHPDQWSNIWIIRFSRKKVKSWINWEKKKLFQVYQPMNYLTTQLFIGVNGLVTAKERFKIRYYSSDPSTKTM